MDSISTISAERRAQDRQIRQDLGFWYGGRLLIVTASDVEGVLRSQERLQAVLDAWVQDESISRYTQVSNFLPSAERQKKRQANLPTLDDLRSRLQQARAQTPFKPGTFEPFLQDVELARQQAVLTPDTVALPSLKARIEPLLFELNKRWVAPVLLYDVQDEAAIELGLKTLRNIDVTYIYLKGESSRILDAAIDRVLRVLGWGGLFIYLVLSFSFRDLLKPFRVLGPTIASVVVVSAIFVFNGIYLTLFHLVSLLLVIGLGLDYSLFFNRLARDESEWGTTFRALWICCVTTVFVFGALLYSETPPLRAIGQTVGLGAGFCLIFGAIWSSNANRHHYRERLQKALARRKVARRAA